MESVFCWQWLLKSNHKAFSSSPLNSALPGCLKEGGRKGPGWVEKGGGVLKLCKKGEEQSREAGEGS